VTKLTPRVVSSSHKLHNMLEIIYHALVALEFRALPLTAVCIAFIVVEIGFLISGSVENAE
jgi:hypothetical protein